eukprot:4490862-Amphidinium_carterae.1
MKSKTVSKPGKACHSNKKGELNQDYTQQLFTPGFQALPFSRNRLATILAHMILKGPVWRATKPTFQTLSDVIPAQVSDVST